MDVILISVLAGVLTAIILIFNSFGLLTRKRFPPGPWGLPIFGHLTFFGNYPPATFSKWATKYGSVFHLRLGSMNAVVISGYDAVKLAAGRSDDAFSDRPKVLTQTILQERNKGVHSVGFGPFTSDYLYHRKHAMNALHILTSKQAALVHSAIHQESDETIKSILTKGNQKHSVQVLADLKECVARTIYRLIYGKSKFINEDDLSVLVQHTNAFSRFAGRGNPFDVMPWLKYILPWKIDELKVMMQSPEDVRVKAVADHIQTFSKSNLRDITDVLLAKDLEDNDANESKGLPRNRLLKACLSDLMCGGFETSATNMQWLVMFMANYPEVQSQVQREIDNVVGKEYKVEWQDRLLLPYTHATINEVMRIVPVFPFSVPRSTKSDLKFLDYDIAAGTMVFFNIHSVHHEKSFWGDPEKFRPERLLDEKNMLDSEKCNHVIPFGLGRRRCLGENLANINIFIFFVTLMQRCTFQRPRGEEYDFKAEPGLTYKPKTFNVTVTERV